MSDYEAAVDMLARAKAEAWNAGYDACAQDKSRILHSTANPYESIPCPLCPRSHNPNESCVEAVPFPSAHIPLIVDGICANCGKSIRETSPWQWTHYVGEYYCNGHDITSRDYAFPDRETIDRIRELRR